MATGKMPKNAYPRGVVKAALLAGLAHKPSLTEAFDAGVDCARNGPSETNCHVRLFCDRAHTKVWEAGKQSEEGMPTASRKDAP